MNVLIDSRYLMMIEERFQYNIEIIKYQQEEINKLKIEASIWTPKTCELRKCDHLPVNVAIIAHKMFAIPISVLNIVKLKSDYKTKMCGKRECEHGLNCTNAHSYKELKFFRKYLA